MVFDNLQLASCKVFAFCNVQEQQSHRVTCSAISSVNGVKVRTVRIVSSISLCIDTSEFQDIFFRKAQSPKLNKKESYEKGGT